MGRVTPGGTAAASGELNWGAIARRTASSRTARAGAVNSFDSAFGATFGPRFRF